MTNITTSLDSDMWQKCKKTGLKWNQLISLGYHAHIGQSATHDDINALKAQTEQLMKATRYLKGELAKMKPDEWGEQ